MRSPILVTALVLSAIVTTGAGCSAPATEEIASGDGSAYSASDLPTEVNRRVATCFARDWSQTELSVRSDPRYATGIVVTPVGDTVAAVFRTLGYLVMRGSEGDKILSQLESDLKETAEQQQLADHQKARLVSCVSSQLISYAMNNISKLLGSSAAAESHEGVCTEYANIYRRLLGALDVDVSFQAGTLTDSAGTGGHAWNAVTIDGKTLWVEPQTNPLRYTGPFFIDPDGASTNPTPETLKCADVGRACTDSSQCCSGSCGGADGAKACLPTPCEEPGTRICTPSNRACTDIGGIPAVRASCGGSVDGSACCSIDLQ